MRLSSRQQQRLQLLPPHGGLDGLGHQGEVRYQGGGLALIVVLAEGDEKHIPAVEQNPQVGGGRAQAVV